MNRAFTIVELLIVIVVIGILAAITVVAYTGAQQRAKLAAAGSHIVKYQKAFRLNAVENGYPTQNACLGTPSAYSGTPGCFIAGQSGNVNASLNTSLSAYGIPTHTLMPLDPANQRFMYVTSFYGNSDLLIYTIPGVQQPCIASPLLSESSPGVWSYAGAKYSEHTPGDNYTLCIVGLR
jgi:prepilin-type N-terminal cleavage/methylation domain-containing protein